MVELVGIGVIFIAGPLALAAWRDQRRAEADKIHAEVSWELARRVGGGIFALRAVPGILHGGSVYVDGIPVPESLRHYAQTIVEAMVPPGYRVVCVCEAQGDSSPRLRPHFQETAISAGKGT